MSEDITLASILGTINDVVNAIDGFVWGPVMLVLLVGTGLYMTKKLNFITFRELPHGFAQMWHGRKSDGTAGELSPFNALMTAMAATIGTGNIVGVATAIFIGGPGALFWMWLTALVGMATKFSEVMLAVKYREITPAGNFVGGAMFFIKNGMKERALKKALKGKGLTDADLEEMDENGLMRALIVDQTLTERDKRDMQRGLDLEEALRAKGLSEADLQELKTKNLLNTPIEHGLTTQNLQALKAKGLTAEYLNELKQQNPGHEWLWLATAFAIFGSIACFGIGNLVQNNAISGVWESSFSIDPTITAILLFIAVGAVVIGGVQRIGEVAGKVVPAMALLYIIVSLLIIITNLGAIPHVFSNIISDALTPTAATGGFAGSTIMLAMRMGMARGIFSNEAGLGSAPIAHAAAATNSPVKQGFIGMLDVFIDTIIVCSMTGFVIMVNDTWTVGLNGAALTVKAFGDALAFIPIPNLGAIIIGICLSLFAFTTCLGWAVYGERCVIYLFGDKGQRPFRFIYCLVVPLGCIGKLDLVWNIADMFNALMAIPNLIGILLLSPVIAQMTKKYLETEKTIPNKM